MARYPTASAAAKRGSGWRFAPSHEGGKQYVFPVEDVPDIEGFANETGRRGAIGMFVALGFAEGAREAIEALGLKALDIDDLLGIVELWDSIKQRTATTSLVYYAKHVEKNSSLAKRLDAFLEEAAQAAEAEN